jgi:hypothetical protein
MLIGCSVSAAERSAIVTIESIYRRRTVHVGRGTRVRNPSDASIGARYSVVIGSEETQASVPDGAICPLANNAHDTGTDNTNIILAQRAERITLVFVAPTRPIAVQSSEAAWLSQW